MKKKMRPFILSCVTITTFMACTNDVPNDYISNKSDQFIITAGISNRPSTRSSIEYDAFQPTSNTRVVYDDNNIGTSEAVLLWEEGDILEIAYYNEDDVWTKDDFTLLPEDAGKTFGRFTGSLRGNTSSGYKVSYKSPDGESGIQQGDNNANHLHNLLSGMINVSSISDLDNVSLSLSASIIKLELTELPTDLGTLKKATWKMFSTNNDCLVSSINVAGIDINEYNNSCILYLVIKPKEIATGGFIQITLEGDKTYITNKPLPNGMTYIAGNRYIAKIDNSDNTAKWETSYDISNGILNLNLASGMLSTLIKTIDEHGDDLSNVTKIVINGTIGSGELEDGSYDFIDPNILYKTPVSSIIGNWLRYKATSVSSIDMRNTELSTLNGFQYCSICQYGNSSLSEMLLPSSLKTIDAWALAYTGITELIVPEGVKDILPNAFLGSKIIKISIPQSVYFMSTQALHADNDAFVVFEYTNVTSGYSKICAKIFDDQTKLRKTTILLPNIHDPSIADEVRSACEYYDSDIDAYFYPKVYYGWNSGEYNESLTLNQKCDPTNYTGYK